MGNTNPAGSSTRVGSGAGLVGSTGDPNPSSSSSACSSSTSFYSSSSISLYSFSISYSAALYSSFSFSYSSSSSSSYYSSCSRSLSICSCLHSFPKAYLILCLSIGADLAASSVAGCTGIVLVGIAGYFMGSGGGGDNGLPTCLAGEH